MLDYPVSCLGLCIFIWGKKVAYSSLKGRGEAKGGGGKKEDVAVHAGTLATFLLYNT